MLLALLGLPVLLAQGRPVQLVQQVQEYQMTEPLALPVLEARLGRQVLVALPLGPVQEPELGLLAVGVALDLVEALFLLIYFSASGFTVPHITY